MRLTTLALAVVLGLPVAAHGQSPGGYVAPSVPVPRDLPPRFTITPRGGALAPIGLPLPQLGLRPPARPIEHARRHREGVFYSWPMMVFYVPAPAAPPAPPPETAPRPIDQAPATGRLILDIEPSSAQIFADGYYVGVPEDFSALRGGGLLDAGPHRIDLSATGYEPVAVDLRIAVGQSVTYRAVLRALPPAASVPPTTFYLIPGCYMGNIPPKDARLPASCDQSRAIAWRP